MKEEFLEQRNIIVIDGFFEDPDAVVEYAKTLEYRGDVAGEHFERTMGMPEEYMKIALEKYLGSKVRDDRVWHETAWSNMNMSFYKTKEGTVPNHVHHDWADYSGVLHLTKDLPSNMGTQLWKHTETGDEFAFGTNKMGWWDTWQDYDRRMDRQEEFEKTDFIAAKYNRLVLFRGQMFHSASIPDNWNGDRLCMLLYFNMEPQ